MPLPAGVAARFADALLAVRIGPSGATDCGVNRSSALAVGAVPAFCSGGGVRSRSAGALLSDGAGSCGCS
ncbi:MAG: hypothetical protein AAFR23_04350, partial [Pseudomonadota bacterium]